jgi:hypothetical protein
MTPQAGAGLAALVTVIVTFAVLVTAGSSGVDGQVLAVVLGAVRQDLGV